jgi:hypothetical protein
MAHSSGKLHDVFVQNVETLANDAAIVGAGFARVWQIPEAITDTTDVTTITAGFDRTEIDTNYAEVHANPSDPGTVGDVVALKVQSDFVAIDERAFRAAHASPVRCLAHAAARRRGHGNNRGVFLGGVMRYVQDALTAGKQ